MWWLEVGLIAESTYEQDLEEVREPEYIFRTCTPGKEACQSKGLRMHAWHVQETAPELELRKQGRKQEHMRLEREWLGPYK